jgi:2-iminobutanoate/2-iminopropanoate deaminase
MKLPFSPYFEKNGFVFISGQVHLDNKGNIIEGSIEEKTHQVMENLQNVLEKAGLTFGNVVKTTIFLTDMDDYRKVNEVYGSYFNEPYPARETICVKALPLGASIEISMIASK